MQSKGCHNHTFCFYGKQNSDAKFCFSLCKSVTEAKNIELSKISFSQMFCSIQFVLIITENPTQKSFMGDVEHNKKAVPSTIESFQFNVT